MRVLKLVDKDGRPVAPPKDGPGHDHRTGDLRCISPFFGAYVAIGCVAVGWAGWKLLAAFLS